MIRIGEGGEELGTNFQRVEEREDVLRRSHPIAYELEKAWASDLRLLAKQVVAKKLRKALRGHCGDERAPPSLEHVQIGRHLHPGEEVVLQEVGRRELQPAGV